MHPLAFPGADIPADAIPPEVLAEALTPLTPFVTDLFVPRYQPCEVGRWQLRVAPMLIGSGYWSPALMTTDTAALFRREADGDPRCWMSMTPMEIESQEIGVRAATGHTVVMGMGMGWATVNAALRPEVTRVTLVELDPDVIEVNRRIGLFDQLPAEVVAKIDIVNGDALDYRSDEPADTLMTDIWLPINGDERMEQSRVMARNTGARRVYVWGQELAIARRARALGLELTHGTVARIVAEFDLPLIGPERPDYPALIARAADKWLKDV
ncbi:hypothetical protein J2848_000942 [Azospirillum lipoferum]|uniref:hypothetical protein n=1 Tax=Azospirillum TaxID=191 RepID=UPI001FE56AFC|nr:MULTISPECIES: hypothetical protein [Azospirillum]MCP1609295.1 hypothetical protein [Azospirillum lipoferum]MDW5535395.1 hypothetical protein [Azospirillum sp. NL1]